MCVQSNNIVIKVVCLVKSSSIAKSKMQADASELPVDGASSENERKRAHQTTPVAAPESDAFLLKKQRKKEKHAAMEAGDWERCMFKLVRKNRFCNMERYALVPLVDGSISLNAD